MASWIQTLIETYGYLGIFLLMLLENIFPPIPSEIILPLAGFIASKGELNPLLVLLSSTFGAMVGVTFWYYVGRMINHKILEKFLNNYGAFLAITLQDYQKGVIFFEKYSSKGVLFGRLIPVIRSVISLPAGMIKMNLIKFIALSSVGTAIWSSLLLYVGYITGSQYNIAEKYIGIVSNIVLAIIAIAYLIKIVTFIKKRIPR